MASRLVSNGRFRAALRNLPDAARREIATGLDRVAHRMQHDAVARIPVRTGRLRKAFASPVAIGKRNRGLEVAYGMRTKGLRKRAWYAHFIEHGTRAYRPGSLRFRGNDWKNQGRYRRVNRVVAAQPARPFFEPAVQRNIPLWRREMRHALQRALQKV